MLISLVPTLLSPLFGMGRSLGMRLMLGSQPHFCIFILQYTLEVYRICLSDEDCLVTTLATL